ncbi:MAG: TetR/AcrR family transcriptional regulator [Pseudomonadota bacterium]
MQEAIKRSKRELILKAAIELFTKKGFEMTNVESIARRAKIAKGTFYNFFDKKEDVLLYFLDKEISKSSDEIERNLGAAKTITEQLELVIPSYIKHIFPSKEFTKVLMKERVTKIGTGKNKNEFVLMHLLTELIDRAQQRNEIRRDIDPRCLAEMIFGFYTVYVIYWANGFISTKKKCIERINEVIRLVIQGVGEKK